MKRKKVYGAQELAATVGVERVNLSMWLARGYYQIPEPDERLACGPVWLDSDELRAWIVKARRTLRARARRRAMAELRRLQGAES